MRVLEIRCDECWKATDDCQCACVVCFVPADGHYQIEDGRWIPVCADGECITLAEGELSTDWEVNDTYNVETRTTDAQCRTCGVIVADVDASAIVVTL